ncbi:hypothetical protein ACS5PK_21305 [Roseateles sp. DB2]|uniref:hypothetical protein n=1 Tax=Roseateles sp. DB2 TaxID=3453717 RepID=UPI003EEDA1AB
MKKFHLIALAALLGTSLAHAAKPAENREVQALRAECAAQHAVNFDTARDDNEYRFVYAKGQLRGEYTEGKALKCTEAQYVAYLDNADPARVMSAYPTAAGRPKAQKSK